MPRKPRLVHVHDFQREPAATPCGGAVPAFPLPRGQLPGIRQVYAPHAGKTAGSISTRREIMRIRTSMLALGLSLGALAAAPAFAANAPAASSAKAMTAQQSKMATCSHQSKGMEGDSHKKFMSDCLHGKTDTAATTTAKPTQQEKMKTCNADAKTKALKGDARKSFMSSCLKG
jgi:hypothetical protein